MEQTAVRRSSEIAREAYYEKLTTTTLAGASDYDAIYASSDWLPGGFRLARSSL